MKNLKIGLTGRKNLEIIITNDRTTKNAITAFDGNVVDLTSTSLKIKDSRIIDSISTVDKMNQELAPLEMEIVFYDGKYVEDTLSVEHGEMIKSIHDAIYDYIYPDDCGKCIVQIHYNESAYQIHFEFDLSLYSIRIHFNLFCRYNLINYSINDKRVIFDYTFRASHNYLLDVKPADDRLIALKRFTDSNQYPLFVEQVVKAISNMRDRAEFSWGERS